MAVGASRAWVIEIARGSRKDDLRGVVKVYVGESEAQPDLRI